MDHLYLLERGSHYTTVEARILIYLHERCGRRTGETVRLIDDCISYDNVGQAYLEWKQGKPPFRAGPRLPIHQDVHDAIRQWQEIKRQHGVSSEWLFPAPQGRNGKSRAPEFLGSRLKELISAVERQAPYLAEVENVDGNLIYFDLASIDPYSFRHAFAQRHADATDENGRSTFVAEELKEWMGHRNYNTTMSYFRITAKRKRHALASLPSRRLNFLGMPVPIDRERDAFTKLAVSLGSCTEPGNVASGGHSCVMDHACESCPFFLVDPFEKDGLMAKRMYLKSQLERITVIAPESHMADHYRSRIADCDRIVSGIDSFVEKLAPDERQMIETALLKMADVRRRAVASRRIDLRDILRESS